MNNFVENGKDNKVDHFAKKYNLIIFEVISLEKLNLKKDELKEILKHLNQIGYVKVINEKNTNFFHLSEENINKEIIKDALGEEDYIWLICKYFDDLIVIEKNGNVLFALASEKPINLLNPYGQKVEIASTVIGGYIYPPTIPRILLAKTLMISGEEILSKKIDCTTSLPTESSITGDIIINDKIVEKSAVKLIIDDLEINSLTILDKSFLITSRISELILKPELLEQVFIAKVIPFSMGTDSLHPENNFKLFNHYSIKAKSNSTYKIFDTLLDLALNFNWNLSKDLRIGQINHKEAHENAIKQKICFETIENIENKITNSLQLLQRRYPERVELFEWEINNIYSNITRFSPTHLALKSSIDSFIDGNENRLEKMGGFLAKINWEMLNQNDVADVTEGQKIISLLNIDPASTLTRMRIIIERIIQQTYTKKISNKTKNLADMLFELNNNKVFPPIIYIYLNMLRIAGNIGAHQGEGSKEEIEAMLPIFVVIVGWFLNETQK